MAWWIALLGILWTTAGALAGVCAPSTDRREEEIFALLDLTVGALPGQPVEQQPNEVICGTPRLADYFFLTRKWPAGTCNPDVTLENVCRAADTYCSRKASPDTLRTATCWDSGESCIPELVLLEKRRPLLAYGGTRFYGLLRDRSMQKLCCGDDKECLRKWMATKLILHLGLGADDETAHFSFKKSDHNIHLSLGRLANCTTNDCVDTVFFHELGHACQYWRWNAKRDLKYWPSGLETRKDFEQTFSRDITACVFDALEKESISRLVARLDSDGWTPDALTEALVFDSWAHEAFAEALFVTKMSPAGWNRACHTRTDSLHCRARIYLGCFLHMKEVRGAICGVKD